jgi:hypothetical protein
LEFCKGHYPVQFQELKFLELKTIPDECLDKQLINSHKYIIDKYFRLENEKPIVRYTSIFLSINKRDWRYLLKIYNDLLKNFQLNDKNQYTISYNFNLKYELFNEIVLSSLIFLLLAIFFILVITMAYLKSLLLTFIVLLCVVFALLQAYFIYKIVLRVAFFPFINLMTLFLLIGLACDDIFVFYGSWCSAKKKFPKSNDNLANMKSLEYTLQYTVYNAVNSIFVTSITTALVFLVNLGSTITNIKLFGLFSFLTIVIDFFFVIVVVPCVLVLYDKHGDRLEKWISFLRDKCGWIKDWKIWKKTQASMTKMNGFLEVCFHDHIPSVIARFRFVLVGGLSLFGICFSIFVFYKPSLSLPTSPSFQLFTDDNPFEYYDKHISILTDTTGVFLYQLDTTPYLRISYLFGLTADNFGSSWDPDDLGVLKFDKENFNFYSEHSQLFFKNFCHSLKFKNETETDQLNEDSFLPTIEIYSRYKICFFDHLRKVFDRACMPNATNMADKICCEQQYPFEENILKYCLRSKEFLFKYIQGYQSFFYERLIFEKSTGLIRTLEYQQVTSYIWSANYEHMQTVHKHVEKFFSKQLRHSVIRHDSNFNVQLNSFFTSDFEFFDLQKNLLESTIQSFLVSLAVVFVVMLLSTGNLLVTIYALFTIVLAISSTVGLLALLGWQLNVIESVTIILAIGLSIDFVVHFGVAYCTINSTNCTYMDRIEIVKECFKSLGSAVLMAGMTTFLAGASMMPAPLLSFKLYGIFLMVVMTFSVLFAYFLFLPLLSVLGPTGNLGQLRWSVWLRRIFRKFRRTDGAVVLRNYFNTNGNSSRSSQSSTNNIFVIKM